MRRRVRPDDSYVWMHSRTYYPPDMVVTASQLRQDVYRLLDHVLETGEAIEIDRKGRRLRIVAAAEPVARLSNAPAIEGLVVGDAGDLVHLDWAAEWRP